MVRVARSALYESCREADDSDSVPRGQRLKIVGDFVELVMANWCLVQSFGKLNVLTFSPVIELASSLLHCEFGNKGDRLNFPNFHTTKPATEADAKRRLAPNHGIICPRCAIYSLVKQYFVKTLGHVHFYSRIIKSNIGLPYIYRISGQR